MSQSEAIIKSAIPQDIIRLVTRGDNNRPPQFVPVEEMFVVVAGQALGFKRYAWIFYLHETLELRVTFYGAYDVQSHSVYYYRFEPADNFYIVGSEGNNP